MNPEVMDVLRELTGTSTGDIDDVLESQTGVEAHHEKNGDLILEGQPWQLRIAEVFLMDKYNAAIMANKGCGKTTGKYFPRSSTVMEKDIDISMTDDSTSDDNLIIQEPIQPSVMRTTNRFKMDSSEDSTNEVSLPHEWAQVKLRKTFTAKQLEIPTSDSSNEVVNMGTMLPARMSSIRRSVDFQASNKTTSEFVKPPESAKVSLMKTVQHKRDNFSIKESDTIITTQPGSVRQNISMFEGKGVEDTIPPKRIQSKIQPAPIPKPRIKISAKPLLMHAYVRQNISMFEGKGVEANIPPKRIQSKIKPAPIPKPRIKISAKPLPMPKPRIKIPDNLFTRPVTTGENSNSFPNDDDITSPAGIVQTSETVRADGLCVDTGPTVNAGTELNSMETLADDISSQQTQGENEFLFSKRLMRTRTSEEISGFSSRPNSSTSDTTTSSTFSDSPHNTSSSSSSTSDTL